MNIGYKIRKLREELGISQLEFSKKIKMSNSVLSRIEQGERSVRDDELIVFADFFGVSTDYLLGRTDIRELNTSPSKTDTPKEPTITTIAAHSTDSTGVKDIEGLKELINSLIDEKLEK